MALTAALTAPSVRVAGRNVVSVSITHTHPESQTRLLWEQTTSFQRLHERPQLSHAVPQNADTHIRRK